MLVILERKKTSFTRVDFLVQTAQQFQTSKKKKI